VLQRLLGLNHERYAEEVEQGLHAKKGAAQKVPAKKRATRLPAEERSVPFDMDETDE
jgi:hypothetical protein